MSRKPVQSLLATICWLLFATAPASAWYPSFSTAIKREKWTGLAGTVSKDGEQVKLPDLLWEIKEAANAEGELVIPKPIVHLTLPESH